MKTVTVYSAPWYPGDALLHKAVQEAGELSGPDVRFRYVDTSVDVAKAEKELVVTIPTVVLTIERQERRRLLGAVGLKDLCDLANVKVGRGKTAKSRRKADQVAGPTLPITETQHESNQI